MRIDVHFTLPEVDPAALTESTAVVIDVLRATSTIVEALANGAGGVYPTTSAGDAARLAASLGREDTLLCGEQKGLKVDGFDLGNSPAEFVEEIVAGKKLVMSTSNGTRARALPPYRSVSISVSGRICRWSPVISKIPFSKYPYPDNCR